jgi:Golgi phosphoprotein 3
LYEEIMLLALRDQKGTVLTAYTEYAVAGAVLAELLLDQRISINDDRRKRVNLNNTSPVGDPVIDECLEKMKDSKRRASLKTWIERLARIKHLRHKAALNLCHKGILKAEEDKILLIFNRKIYPEVNPLPEKDIIEQMREAIFTDKDNIDPKTVVLISLAKSTDLLKHVFDHKKLRGRKQRIKQIINGEMLGKATREIIEACQAAAALVAIMPAITSAATN